MMVPYGKGPHGFFFFDILINPHDKYAIIAVSNQSLSNRNKTDWKLYSMFSLKKNSY